MPTPEATETVMEIEQQSFMSAHLGQEVVAGINANMSATVHKMGTLAPPDMLQKLTKVVEDGVYHQHLATFIGKNIHNDGDSHPKIRTLCDQHAIAGTDRKPVFRVIKQLHTLRGCQAELSAPYPFLQDVGAILQIFEEQFSEGNWTKNTVIQKHTFLCQFLEMISEFKLKDEYYAVLSQFIGTLEDPEPTQTMSVQQVTELHSKIETLYDGAVEQLSHLDEFKFEYYGGAGARGPLQIVMDALCLLYIWGDSTDHSNLRRLLQTFTYKSADTNLREDNYITLHDDGRVTVQVNHVTKVDRTFEPMEINLTEVNPKFAHLLKLWRPIAQKFQCGAVFIGSKQEQKTTPKRSNPYVIFRYEYGSCNKDTGKLGAPLGKLHTSKRVGWYDGTGFQKQAQRAADRLGYDKDMAKQIGSCNTQRHVEAAANRLVQAPTVEEEAAIRARGRRRGSSGRAMQTQYAQDQRTPGQYSPNNHGWSEEELAAAVQVA